jgi:transcriptional regulator CtsR
MSTQNSSDLIEAYLKQLLAEAAEIEIKRNEIADRFDVVPSQINYVIKTRFTETQGFDVESKRGGGGYIRIVKFHYSAKHDLLEKLYQRLPSVLSIRATQDYLQFLFDEGLLTEREGNMLLAVLSCESLTDEIRGQLAREILQELDKENDI